MLHLQERCEESIRELSELQFCLSSLIAVEKNAIQSILADIKQIERSVK